MKRYIFPIIFVFIMPGIFNGCGKEKKFVISGSFKVVDPTPVQLYYLAEKESRRIDSVFASEGRFELSAKIDHSGIYLMKFFNDQSIYLVIHPGDRMNIDIDNTGQEISYYVENSPDSKRIKELTDKQNFLLRRIDELSRHWEIHRSDVTMRHEIDSAYMDLMMKHKQYSLDFIYGNPKSLSNIMALYQNFGRKSQPLFDRYDDFEIFSFVDSNLVIVYPESDAVQTLNREVNETIENIRQNQYIEKLVTQGRPIPAFHYPDITGDTIAAVFPGNKPFLILFWATWNELSVHELLLLNSYRQKHALDNIKVVTVSLDSSEEKLKAFLLKNHIELPVVCDFAYWDSEIAGRYSVKKIPSTILSNRQGMIVGMDDFGENLINRLKLYQ